MLLLVPYYALRTWSRGEPSRALAERLGSLPPEIAARSHATLGGGRFGGAPDLDSRRVGRRSAGSEAACRGPEAALSGARDFRLDDHGDRPAPRARAVAIGGRHLLFSARLDRARAARSARDAAGDGDRDGNGDLAEFPARGAAARRSRGFRERANFGAVVRALQALEIPRRRIFRARSAGWRALSCADARRRGAARGNGRAGGIGRSDGKSEI